MYTELFGNEVTIKKVLCRKSYFLYENIGMDTTDKGTDNIKL